MRKFFSLCTVATTVLIALLPSVSSKCAADAVSMCINVLIPSLFPFIVCANLFASLGITEKISHLFSKVTSFLFRINGCCAFPFIMGIISGYPVGMITCCKMYSEKKLSKNEASRLMMFANNSGPVFIISAVGLGVFSSVRTGIIMYISHVAAAVSVGIMSRFFGSETSSSTNFHHQRTSPSNVISESIMSILTLCGYVIFFSVILGLLEKTYVLSLISRLFSCTRLETGDITLLSRGIFEISSALFTSTGTSAEVAVSVISFGGISVLFQSMYFCRKCGLSIKPYIIGKFLCGGFSAFYCHILMKLSPSAISAFSQSAKQKLYSYTPYFLVFSLLCFIFIFIVFSRLPQDDKSVYPEKRNLTHTRS